MLAATERLIIEWIDARGKVWNLTDGTEGVVLDVDQSDFTLSPVEHHYARGGTQWAGATVGRAEPSLKVVVGYDTSSTAYYQLADEWWAKANSFTAPGTLKVTRPDGVVRYLIARLRDTPGTTYQFDPGAGITDPPGEPWFLTSPSSYYSGPARLVRFDSSAFAGGTPFYGHDGTGWPLHIGAAQVANNLFVDNLGEGPVWPTWELTGPMSNVFIATGTGTGLSLDLNLGEGQRVVITTDPAERSVRDADTGISYYNRIRGAFVPIPPGEQIPIRISADGMVEGSAVELRFSEQFARPF